jgi:CheY-like chemotaxis protein
MGFEPILLLVEDNEDDAFLMVRAMKSAGIDRPLKIISDGQEALNYLSGLDPYSPREAYPLPGLILLDIKLPQISGLEVLRWLRSLPQLRHIIVIMLTSSNHPGDVRQAYEFGANSYVVKPASFQQLLEFAQAFKAYWLSCNHSMT